MKNTSWWWIFLGAIGFGLILNFLPWLALIIILSLVILLLATQPGIGAYLLVLTGFLTGLEIDFSRYLWAREIPYLAGVNAPLVDLITLAVIGSLLVAWFGFESNSKKRTITIPGWQWYGLFLVAGLISIFLAPAGEHNLILKAWFRPQVFVFVGLFITFIMSVRNKMVLDAVLKTWFGVGIATALFALFSLIISVGNSVWRATPFAIWGYAPFGYNHNLLAEALVVTLPVALYFFVTAKDKANKYLAGLTSGFIGLMTLLTLSRAAWLATAVVVLVFVHYYQLKIKPVKELNFLPTLSRLPIFLAVVLVPVIAYMGLFLTSTVVTSSTSARWEVTKMVGWNVARAPLFGYGPGQFIAILGDNAIYRLEYGDPLDAHGFVQKILIENGLVGLVFFGLFLWSQIKHTVIHKNKLPREMLFLAQALVLSGIVFQLFNTSYYHAVFWLPLALAVVLINFATENN